MSSEPAREPSAPPVTSGLLDEGLERVRTAVLKKHHTALRYDDPVLIIGTAQQLLFEEAMSEASRLQADAFRRHQREIEVAFHRWQQQATRGGQQLQTRIQQLATDQAVAAAQQSSTAVERQMTSLLTSFEEELRRRTWHSIAASVVIAVTTTLLLVALIH